MMFENNYLRIFVFFFKFQFQKTIKMSAENQTKNQTIRTVLIANVLMLFGTGAVAWEFSFGKINAGGFSVIFLAVCLLNLIAGAGMKAVRSPESKYFLRAALICLGLFVSLIFYSKASF